MISCGYPVRLFSIVRDHENPRYMIQDSVIDEFGTIFFLLLITAGSFFLLNITLAIVLRSFMESTEQLAKKSQKGAVIFLFSIVSMFSLFKFDKRRRSKYKDYDVVERNRNQIIGASDKEDERDEKGEENKDGPDDKNVRSSAELGRFAGGPRGSAGGPGQKTPSKERIEIPGSGIMNHFKNNLTNAMSHLKRGPASRAVTMERIVPDQSTKLSAQQCILNVGSYS